MLRNELINDWILEKFYIAQERYFFFLEKDKWEINLAMEEIVNFTQQTFSKQYLDLIRRFNWDNHTENTVLFIQQQLLRMLHPATPFITSYLYKKIAKEEILLDCHTELPEFRKKENTWQVDCLFLIISNIREIKKKQIINFCHLRLSIGWEKPVLDFNYFLENLLDCRINILNNDNQKNVDFSLLTPISLLPFGTLWYISDEKKELINELYKKLKASNFELLRSVNLLSNPNFVKKASKSVVEKEKKKRAYYSKQVKDLELQIFQLEKENKD